MTEGKKIGIACAIGGAIGTVVALIVAAPFWWLGLLAGFAGGYVSYEFRAVLRAVPKAWRMTREEVAPEVVGFFRESHPILYPCFLVAASAFYAVANSTEWKPGVEWSRWVFGCLAGFIAAHGLFILPLAVGFKRRECVRFGCNPSVDDAMWMVANRGFGYRQVLLLFVHGVLFIMWSLVAFPFKFIFVLVRLIHSDKRLLCGVDAAIGTGVAYLTLIRPHRVEMTVGQMVTALIAVAAISAVLGIVNYELVSKRWLRVEEHATRS